MFTFSTFEYEIHKQRLQELEQQARYEAQIREFERAGRLSEKSLFTRSSRALAGILYSIWISIQKLPQVWLHAKQNPCAEA
mgnify:CR=1 FL=1